MSRLVKAVYECVPGRPYVHLLASPLQDIIGLSPDLVVYFHIFLSPPIGGPIRGAQARASAADLR